MRIGTGIGIPFQFNMPLTSLIAAMFQSGEQGAWYDPSDIDLTWRRNLLTKTEQFEDAVWFKQSTSISANSVVAPDGTQTADTITATSTANTWVRYNSTGQAANTSYTLSCYAKAGTCSWLRLNNEANNASGGAWFNLSNGTVGTVTSGATATIVSLGDGWYRCSSTITSAASITNNLIDVRMSSGDNTISVVNGSFLYIWGAQLEVGSTASAYQRITDGVQDYFVADPQPVLFQDSAGTTPVTAVEQPVGLVLDKRKGLVPGSEQLSAAAVGLVGTATAATYNTTTGAGSVSRVDLSNQSYVQWSSLTPNGFYRISVSCQAGTIIIRTGIFSGPQIASIAAGQSITIYGNADNAGRITITNTSSSGTSTFTVISVRELPGNHAYQSTSASRPVLSARVNLLTKTEQFDDAAWVKSNITATANATTAPDGTLTADALIENTTNAQHQWYQQPTVIAATHIFSLYAKRISGSSRYFAIYPQGATAAWAVFDLTTGTITATGGANYSASSITSVGDGWYKCSVTFTTTAASLFSTLYLTNSSGSPSNSYTGDGTSGIYIWGADLRVANTGVNLPAYQRVNTATDYDTVGFPKYLKFDGVDDFLLTNPIDFSATAQMTVVAGVRRVTTAGNQMVAELGVGDQTGSFYVLLNTGAVVDRFRSQGTVGVSADEAVSSSFPMSKVLTGLGNISGDSAILRVNGAQAGSNTADQGTGNFGNYPLYIGRRGGTSLPFNGHLYGLIVRGAQTDAGGIANSERYMNTLTKAY